jgi:amidohydrolase
MELKSLLQARSQEIFDEVLATRREIHANPELSFEEFETANRVKRWLDKCGIDYDDGVAKTGVVGYIKGKGEGKTIALRADMDALPIVEANDVPYKSLNPGKMHACGHDVHTSSLLGTAKLLQEVRDQFSGTIKLLFQPSEERIPGGASVMIQEGVLRNPDVQSIFGQHVMPYIPAGKIGMRSGRYMASADEIYFTVKGKGGHAAHPHAFVDPVLATAHILTALQSVVSRNADPRKPSVLSFGRLMADGATNIIPNEVQVDGTFRAMDETWRAEAHRRITQIVHSVAEAMGCTVELEIRKGYPMLFNDEALTDRARLWAQDYVGAENVEELDLWMAAEDFSYYTHEVPGCFYRLGTRNEALGIVHGLHTPLFNIDESALRLSTGLMAWMAVKELQEG